MKPYEPGFTELTGASFSEFVRLNEFAVVHFWAAWNGHDGEMRKVLASQLAAALSKRVAFGTFDTDPPEHHEICRKHNVLGLPFLAFYRNGSFIRKTTGLLSVGALEKHLAELVGPESC